MAFGHRPSTVSPDYRIPVPICSTLRSRLDEAWSFILTYCRYSSIHGLVFFVKKNVGRTERLFWLCAILLSIAILQELVRENLQSYFDAPTETTILDHDVSLWKVEFPALSICFNAMIRPTIGKRIIQTYLAGMAGNHTNAVPDNTVMSLLTLMDLFKFSTFDTMKFYVDRLKNLLPYFDGLSISETFYKEARPSCEYLFLTCYWHGVKFNCCEKFYPQMTENGFCFSFNSYTAQRRFPWYYIEQNVNFYSESGCGGTSTGAGTGLEVFFREPNNTELAEMRAFRAQEQASLANEYDEIANLSPMKYHLRFQLSTVLARSELFRIVVHRPNEVPDVSSGFLMSTYKDERLSLSVSFRGSRTSAAVSSLPPERRNCLFNGESFPDYPFNNEIVSYQQHTCIVACRTLEILRLCGCVPYYTMSTLHSKYGRAPECRFTQLRCLADIAKRLVRMTAPEGQPGFSASASDARETINCTHCKPSCDRARYTTQSGKSQATYFSVTGFMGYVELFFDPYSVPVLYQTELAYDTIQLLVVFGGITCLFLGFSMISVVEIVLLVLRTLQALLGLTDSRMLVSKRLTKS